MKCVGDAESLDELHVLSGNLEELLKELREIEAALDALQGSRRRFILSSSLLSLLSAASKRVNLECPTERRSLSASLAHLDELLTALTHQPTSSSLQDQVSCAASKTVEAFTLVVRGTEQVNEEDRQQVERVLHHITTERMQQLTSVLQLNKEANLAEKERLTREMKELKEKKRKLEDSIREAREMKS
ncbi:uncharacterized protein LOC123511186 [Portunus trituberculatus]|uniref:uncharacterized protein LOC123511186 n=1 Tax=Portunus trituberculatus TaxID=210409 RepID=UPI001E1CD454|nr:uncharacterized protein LOC123511186 [Portunus trituberculatus]